MFLNPIFKCHNILFLKYIYSCKSVMPRFIMYVKKITGNLVQVNGLTIPNLHHSDNLSQPFEQVAASKAVVAQTRPLRRTSLFVCLSDHNGNGYKSRGDTLLAVSLSQYLDTADFVQLFKMVTDMEYVKMAEETFIEAMNIARSEDGWKVEKEDKANEVLVECKKNAKGKKIYRCKAKIPMPASLLAAAIKDTDKITSWNYTLTEARVLKKINDNVAISYQITTDAAGGMVSARDFIYLSQLGYEGEEFIMGGKSVEFEGGPKSSKIVRAINGPGCQIVTPFPGDPNCCTFLWLMDCEYKGMMLQSILDIALPIAQTSFVECIKKLGAKLKEEGKF